ARAAPCRAAGSSPSGPEWRRRRASPRRCRETARGRPDFPRGARLNLIHAERGSQSRRRARDTFSPLMPLPKLSGRAFRIAMAAVGVTALAVLAQRAGWLDSG